MSRVIARESAFQILFEFCVRGKKNQIILKELFDNDPTLNYDEREYIEKVYNGVIDHYEDLKQLIKKYSENFDFNRIFKTDLAILFLAVYEIKYIPTIKNVISINEACNLAKKFSTPKSYKFINGVLAGINKEIESDE